jgi:hypothetical protein
MKAEKGNKLLEESSLFVAFSVIKAFFLLL